MVDIKYKYDDGKYSVEFTHNHLKEKYNDGYRDGIVSSDVDGNQIFKIDYLDIYNNSDVAIKIEIFTLKELQVLYKIAKDIGFFKGKKLRRKIKDLAGEPMPLENYKVMLVRDDEMFGVPLDKAIVPEHGLVPYCYNDTTRKRLLFERRMYSDYFKTSEYKMFYDILMHRSCCSLGKKSSLIKKLRFYARGALQ